MSKNSRSLILAHVWHIEDQTEAQKYNTRINTKATISSWICICIMNIPNVYNNMFPMNINIRNRGPLKKGETGCESNTSIDKEKAVISENHQV